MEKFKELFESKPISISYTYENMESLSYIKDYNTFKTKMNHYSDYAPITVKLKSNKPGDEKIFQKYVKKYKKEYPGIISVM